MTTMLAGAVLALAMMQQTTDTTVAVPADGRLLLNTMGGDVVVRTWARNAVRVQAEHSSRTTIGVETSGSVVTVKARARQGAPGVPGSIDFELTVPRSMAVDLSGTYLSATVEGTAAPVAVRTVNGDIAVRGGSGAIDLETVQGSIEVEGTTGRMNVRSVNEDITIRGASGEVRAETINGDLVLERVRSTRVEAATVNGDVSYDGTIADGGRYAFITHSGDITIGVPDGTNATISVSTFSGDFDSNLQIRVSETRPGRRFSITLGSGAAAVELESFNGEIRLVRGSLQRDR